MIKQLIPQGFCLKCRNCCRFSKQNSVWAPCLLDEEIQGLLDKDMPPASISIDKRLCLIMHPEQEGFICPFLDAQSNKCKIYDSRPFECQLYPFLLSLRNKKVLLTVDLNCPYVKENLNAPAFKEYSECLAKFLNSPRQLAILKNNPRIIQAYEEVLEIIELKGF